MSASHDSSFRPRKARRTANESKSGGVVGAVVAAKSDGDAAFEWLIHPMTKAQFYKEHWEKKPLLIRRDGRKEYYRHLMTTATIKSTWWAEFRECVRGSVLTRRNCDTELLQDGRLTYAQDVDVTRYKDGKRESQLAEGVANVDVVWPQFTKQGYSVRMLCPHRHVAPLRRLMTRLENHFNCFVGCNTFVMPS